MFENTSPGRGKGSNESLNITLPEKKYFRIGEVARLLKVKPYVLRYWETEFPQQLKPQKSRTNQRLYRRKDVESLISIRELLYVKKYTIAGARQALKTGGSLLDGMPEATSAQESFIGPADRFEGQAEEAVVEMPRATTTSAVAHHAGKKTDQLAFGFNHNAFKDLSEIESELKSVIAILDSADVQAQERAVSWRLAS
jgi:DNA-binding transcriptional MerR regulator